MAGRTTREACVSCVAQVDRVIHARGPNLIHWQLENINHVIAHLVVVVCVEAVYTLWCDISCNEQL